MSWANVGTVSRTSQHSSTPSPARAPSPLAHIPAVTAVEDREVAPEVTRAAPDDAELARHYGSDVTRRLRARLRLCPALRFTRFGRVEGHITYET